MQFRGQGDPRAPVRSSKRSKTAIRAPEPNAKLPSITFDPRGRLHYAIFGTASDSFKRKTEGAKQQEFLAPSDGSVTLGNLKNEDGAQYRSYVNKSRLSPVFHARVWHTWSRHGGMTHDCQPNNLSVRITPSVQYIEATSTPLDFA